MLNMRKILTLVLISAAFLFSNSNQALAASSGAYGQPCPGGYGQNECFTNILVDKIGNLKLIDFGWASDEEYQFLPDIDFSMLNGEYSLIDLESFEKILREINK